MTFSEAPLWFQASVVSAFVGGFAGVLWLVSVLLNLIPPVYRFFDRVLGEEDELPIWDSPALDISPDRALYEYDPRTEKWRLHG